MNNLTCKIQCNIDSLYVATKIKIADEIFDKYMMNDSILSKVVEDNLSDLFKGKDFVDYYIDGDYTYIILSDDNYGRYNPLIKLHKNELSGHEDELDQIMDLIYYHLMTLFLYVNSAISSTDLPKTEAIIPKVYSRFHE